MIAALPMYDWPEAHGALDAFWARLAPGLAAVLGPGVPGRLSRAGRHDAAWGRADLALGQACGLPLVSGHCGRAVPVARPVFAAEGCGPGTYRSALVVRRAEVGRGLDAFRGAVAAVNEPGSMSGALALAAALPAGEGFFARVHRSGSHRASARAVAAGVADVAALDAVAWALLQAIEPATARKLAVLGWTVEVPALPWLTAAANAPAAAGIAAALDRAARAMPQVHPALPVAAMPAVRGDWTPVARLAASVPLARIAVGFGSRSHGDSGCASAPPSSLSARPRGPGR